MKWTHELSCFVQNLYLLHIQKDWIALLQCKIIEATQWQFVISWTFPYTVGWGSAIGSDLRYWSLLKQTHHAAKLSAVLLGLLSATKE